MESINLIQIIKTDNRIQYSYTVTAGLQKFFSKMPFNIEYPEYIENVPDSIAAIPFVSNVLPIIWLTNATLVVRELDENFYNCIPNVKKGYEMMYPEIEFKGNIEVMNIVESPRGIGGKCATFYSGGLDSVQTLISHLNEKPDLISIWGSDVKYNNKEGWKLVHSVIEKTSERYKLSDVVIRSTFREFDQEVVLDRTYQERLQDGWWHGVKHGIGLLGHVAPYAYLHGLSTIYIASSHCPTDGHVRCASNPLIDNRVRFAGCKVVHDGFEYSRQDKVHNLVEFCKSSKEDVHLHVCWQSQSGGNCCHCEKCYRTIAGLLAEGEEPKKYGFEDVEGALDRMQIHIIEWEQDLGVLKTQWTYIHDRAVENKFFLMKKQYWKKFKWVLSADFSHPESLRMPIMFRIKRKISYLFSGLIIDK